MRENGNNPRIIFYDTWGRPGRHEEDGLCESAPQFCSYDGMQDRLTETYQTLAWNNRPAEVAPAGETLRYMKNVLDYDFYDTKFYQADRSHATVAGSYMVASVISQKITGMNNKKTGADLYLPTGVDAALAGKIHEAADAVVTSNDPKMVWDYKLDTIMPCAECSKYYTVGSGIVPPKKKAGLDVLFLGNSYTYYNDMPDLVKEFCGQNGDQIPLTITKYAKNDGELLYYLTADVLNGYINKAYDVVIIQEQSTNPSKSYAWVKQNSFPTTETIVQKIREFNSKTRIIFYNTWGRKEMHENNLCTTDATYCSYDGMQDRLTESYRSFAWINKPAEVAPVGETLRKLKDEFDFDFFDTKFYMTDKSHPTPLGSAMIASVIAQKICKYNFITSAYTPPGTTADQVKMIGTAANETINADLKKWDFKVGDPSPCPMCTDGYMIGQPVLPPLPDITPTYTIIGNTCKFPFKETDTGPLFYECTDSGTPGATWCATESDANQKMTNWNYCIRKL